MLCSYFIYVVVSTEPRVTSEGEISTRNEEVPFGVAQTLIRIRKTKPLGAHL